MTFKRNQFKTLFIMNDLRINFKQFHKKKYNVLLMPMVCIVY